MKLNWSALAISILGCMTIRTLAQTGVCDQKSSTTPCIEQPVACANEITGKASAGASICIKVDGKTAGSTTANSDGAFDIGVPALVLGQSVAAEQTTAPLGTTGPVGVKEPDDIRVESAAANGTSLDLVPCPKAMAEHVLVQDTGLQARVKALQKGDHVSVVVGGQGDKRLLQWLTVRTVSVAGSERVRALIISAAVIFGAALILTWGHPFKLIIGEDGRYSNSKFQMALWWGIAIATYVATVGLRVVHFGGDFIGGVNIPQNLFLLSGMSTFTFAAAKGITTQKIATAKANGDPAPKPSAKQPHILSDLTSNDSNQLDLGDFQMLVVTLLAIVSYGMLIFHFLGSLEMRANVSFPDLDTTILAAFGLGHGAYLTKKAVGEVGKT